MDAAHVEAMRGATIGERWGASCIAERATDVAIGSCRLHRDRHVLELSNDLVTTHWGRGLATEAGAAVIDWAWTHTADESIIAVTQRANARSLALLDRLGFEHETTFVEFDAPQTQMRLHRPAKREAGQ